MICRLFGHRSVMLEGDTLALIGCTRCGEPLETWRLLRPERLAPAHYAAQAAEQEARARQGQEAREAFWRWYDGRRQRLWRVR